MAEKFKKRLSRRSQERQNRALRTFDLTMLGMVIVTLVCAVLCYFRGADLKPGASSGFAYWFLVMIGYLPMLPVNIVRTIFGMPIPATGEHTELYLHSTAVLILLVALWLTIRVIGKRNTKSQLLHIGTRVAQLFLCWGVFQLCCWAITVGLNRGWRTAGKPQTPKTEMTQPAEQPTPKAETPETPAATAKVKTETPETPAAPATKK